MVKETRIIVGPSDIWKVRLVCHCGGEVLCPFRDTDGKVFVPPSKCPHCNEPWEKGVAAHTIYERIKDLMDAVRYLSELDNHPRLSVLLEIDGEPAKEPSR